MLRTAELLDLLECVVDATDLLLQLGEEIELVSDEEFGLLLKGLLVSWLHTQAAE